MVSLLRVRAGIARMSWCSPIEFLQAPSKLSRATKCRSIGKRGGNGRVHDTAVFPACWRSRSKHIFDHFGHRQVIMRKIRLKDAKASLSAVVDQATRGDPSVITRHGKPEGVRAWYRGMGAPVARSLVWPAS